MEQIFIEITAVIIIAVLISGLMRLLKQPLIIGYILTGLIVSPYALDIVKAHDALGTFAELGVALLLFLVGLNLNPKIVKDVGKVSLITGASQITLSVVLAYIIMISFGFDFIVSLYISIAIAFSSTIIIMKFLTDKKELDSLHGKLAIGLLIIQDIVAMFILLIISAVNTSGDVTLLVTFALIKGFVLIIVVMLLGLYILPRISAWIAKSQEFLLMFSIGWCLVFAAGFYLMNFSMEVGALLAGVTLALSPYRHEISSKLRPLRDFFLVLFFILLGTQMVFKSTQVYLIPIIALSVFALVIKPIIVTVLFSLFGYSKRTAFLSGITMAQISEFSLIVVGLGVSVGHLSNEILSMITIVGIITIAGSSYMMKYSNKIYPLFANALNFVERKGRKIDEHGLSGKKSYDIIMFGYNRIGHDILESLRKMKTNFLVVDYNPDTIEYLAEHKIHCKYGDANDLELINDLDFENSKMIISTVPDIETNQLLVNRANEINSKIITIVVSHQIDESLELYKAGATYVVMPHFLGGKHTSLMIESYGLNLNKFMKERISHIKNLKTKSRMGHEHPKTNRTDYR